MKVTHLLVAVTVLILILTVSLHVVMNAEPLEINLTQDDFSDVATTCNLQDGTVFTIEKDGTVSGEILHREVQGKLICTGSNTAEYKDKYGNHFILTFTPKRGYKINVNVFTVSLGLVPPESNVENSPGEETTSYHEKHSELPGQYFINREYTDGRLQLCFYSEEFFRIEDSANINKAKETNEEYAKWSYKAARENGHSFVNIAFEDIGGNQYLVTYCNSDGNVETSIKSDSEVMTILSSVGIKKYPTIPSMNHGSSTYPLSSTPAMQDFSQMVGAYKNPSGNLNVWISNDGKIITLINEELYEGQLDYIGANSAKQSNGSTTLFFTVVDDTLVITVKPDNTRVTLYRYI